MKRVEMLLFMLGIVFILTFWLASREEKIPFKLWYYTGTRVHPLVLVGHPGRKGYYQILVLY